MPQPTSKPGQPGGNHGPTRPTNFPLAFSSTTNMPAPCNTQCPDMTAAFRHPTSSSVTGFKGAIIAISVLRGQISRGLASGDKRGAYHPCKIRLAVRLGKQQHTGVEMAVVDNGFIRIT